MKDPKITSNGFLVESDTLSLSTDLTIRVNTLHDVVNDAHHTLDPRASQLISMLAHGIVYGDWLAYAKRCLSDVDDSFQILGFLNDIGGLQVQRTLMGRISLKLFRFRRRFHGIKNEPYTRRLPIGIGNLCRAVFYATSSLLVAIVAVSVVLYTVGIQLADVIWYGVGLYCAVWGSIVAHEQVHVWFVADAGAIIQQGMRIGILHKPLIRQREYTSALAGPIVGALFGLIVCASIGEVTHSPYLLPSGYMLVVAHLWSWAPSYGDGMVLWKRKENRRVNS